MPQAEPLRAIRNYMADHASEFIQIKDDASFKKVFSEMYDHQLKTAPKGFPKDHEFIKILKYKSYIFSNSTDDKIITGKNLIDHTIKMFEKLCEVNSFLYKALD